MGSIAAFLQLSLDGFFAGPNGETEWFHGFEDDKFDKFSEKQARPGNTLLMGRTTYEMMKSYWPTEEARTTQPGMAKTMDENPKLVFSRTLTGPESGPHWENVEIASDIDFGALAKAKTEHDFTILGSGSVVNQLAERGLIDEYQFVVNPVMLGAGKSAFDNINQPLRLVESKAFDKSGRVWLRYHPTSS